jgi:hypothetical protein
MPGARLRAAGERRDTIFMQQGITFDSIGDDGPARPATVRFRSTSSRG